MELDELGTGIGVECQASVPYESLSGVWALSEGQWEAIKCSHVPLCEITSVAGWRMDSNRVRLGAKEPTG